MPESDPDNRKLPGTYKQFISKFPALGQAHEQIANAVNLYGPLDARQCSLIKIGISLGAGLESALRPPRDAAGRLKGGNRAGDPAGHEHGRFPNYGRRLDVGAKAVRTRR